MPDELETSMEHAKKRKADSYTKKNAAGILKMLNVYSSTLTVKSRLSLRAILGKLSPNMNKSFTEKLT